MSKKSSCGPSQVDMHNTSPQGGCQGDEYRWTIIYTDPENCAIADGTPYTFVNGSSFISRSLFFNVYKTGTIYCTVIW
jgi:hypothetical protein